MILLRCMCSRPFRGESGDVRRGPASEVRLHQLDVATGERVDDGAAVGGPHVGVEDLDLDVAGVTGGGDEGVSRAKSMWPSPIIPRESSASGGSGVIHSQTW